MVIQTLRLTGRIYDPIVVVLNPAARCHYLNWEGLFNGVKVIYINAGVGEIWVRKPWLSPIGHSQTYCGADRPHVYIYVV